MKSTAAGISAAVIIGIALMPQYSIAEEIGGRQPWRSGLIPSETGFIDKRSGARVEAVERTEEAGDYRVLVSVPRSRGGRNTEIEEVRVTAPRIDDGTPLAPVRYEFVKDYRHDRHGLYIYVGQNKNLPFRLYFKDHSAAEIQNTAH